MRTLIFVLALMIVTVTGQAFEGFNFQQDRWLRSQLPAANQEIKAADLEKSQEELLTRRSEMRRVFQLIEDEVDHIFPLFVGALEGQGAGARFSARELNEFCNEIKNKLAYARSCIHAAQTAAGLNKEEVLNLLKRRELHRRIYRSRIHEFEVALQKQGIVLNEQKQEVAHAE